MSSPVTVPKEFETPEGLRTLANFLRSQNGVRVKSGIEHEKRVDYFKGKQVPSDVHGFGIFHLI